MATSHVRRAGRNFGLLLGGQATGAVLSLLALALMARSLSPAELGIVVLLNTYVVTIRELFNFKLFETIVRYGVPRLDDGKLDSLRRLLRFALQIDVVASIAAALVAMICAPFAAPLFGWETAHTPLAVGFSMALLVSPVGTPKGILRLYGRFEALSAMAIVASSVRLIGAVIAFAMNAGIAGFTLAWAAALVFESCYINWCGWREIQRQLPHAFCNAPVPSEFRDEFPGLWSFVNVVYWQSNLDLLPKHVATLMAGAMLGPVGAGLFRIARELSAVLAKPAVLLRHAVFPDLTRLWHQRDRGFRDLCVKLSALLGIPALAIVALILLFGDSIIGMVLGQDYIVMVPLLVLLLLGAALELMTATLRPAVYAADQAPAILRIQIVSTVIYVVAFIVCTDAFGLIGPGIAACLAMVVAITGMGLVLARKLRELGEY